MDRNAAIAGEAGQQASAREIMRQRRRALISGREPERVSGRISSLRSSARAVFADIHQGGELFQVAALQGDPGFEPLRARALGDWVDIRGSWRDTLSGDRALFAESVELVARCEAGFPPWSEPLSEESARAQQDWARASDPHRMRRTLGRISCVEALRDWARREGLREAITPILAEEPSGAQAEPFWSAWRAGGRELALRVAPENALIRLAVSGIEGLYEIGPSFRNEGISSRHHPEFLMMEAYRVGWGWEEALGASFEAIGRAWEALGGDRLEPWRVFRAEDALLAFGCPEGRESDAAWLRGELERAGRRVPEGLSLEDLRWRALDDLFEPPRYPFALVGHPEDLSPLAAPDLERPGASLRFELYLDGLEIANGYEQLRDPFEQSERFRRQAERAASGEEAMGSDARYLEAMRLGMPRLSGFGLGIERLCQIAFGCSIREALPFPLSGS